MALVPVMLDVIQTTIANLQRTGCKSTRIVSLGYPDILADDEDLSHVFAEDILGKLRFRDDSDRILRWHRMENRLRRVPEAESLFEALGFQLDVIDITAARGNEIILDLNDPVPYPYLQRYAIVLDSGTVEHCFNIGQAIRNIAGMVALGGASIHGNPLNMFNHGFYNLNPTWYHDFYEANGFVVEYLRAAHASTGGTRLLEIPAYSRFSGLPENCTLIAVARRDHLAEFRWPVQTKYRENPDLAR